jgi:hypothetical protein
VNSLQYEYNKTSFFKVQCMGVNCSSNSNSMTQKSVQEVKPDSFCQDHKQFWIYNIKFKKKGNVRINVTLRRVRMNIVAVDKQ